MTAKSLKKFKAHEFPGIYSGGISRFKSTHGEVLMLSTGAHLALGIAPIPQSLGTYAIIVALDPSVGFKNAHQCSPWAFVAVPEESPVCGQVGVSLYEKGAVTYPSESLKWSQMWVSHGAELIKSMRENKDRW